MPLLYWIAKSLLILAIFYLGVPAIVNGVTRNNWSKLPAMMVFAFVAGIFMAWLKYVPYFLFFVWMALTYYSLESMTEQKFVLKTGTQIRKSVFYVSSYSYAVISCLFAWFLQTEIAGNNPNDPWIPLWRHVLGMT